MKIDILRQDELNSIDISHFPDRIRDGIKLGFLNSVTPLKIYHRDLLSGAKTGVYARVHYFGSEELRTIRRSAPGEPPANNSGNFGKTIFGETRGTTNLFFGSSGRVQDPGSPEEIITYAPYLENGTSRMKRRPSLFKTLKDNQGLLQVNIQEGIKNSI